MGKIKCLKCGDIIESRRTHEMVWCSCCSCAVDGGNEYLKVTGEVGSFSVFNEKTGEFEEFFGSKTEKKDTCCFCGKEVEYAVNGHNPRPIAFGTGIKPICCSECNENIVIPTRKKIWSVDREKQKYKEMWGTLVSQISTEKPQIKKERVLNLIEFLEKMYGFR